MSQQKMEQYREYKKNRKEILQKQKRGKAVRTWIGIGIAGLIALGLVVALVITGINEISRWSQARPQYERTEYVISDVAGVLESETETEAETEGSTEAGSEEASTEAASTAAGT